MQLLKVLVKSRLDLISDRPQRLVRSVDRCRQNATQQTLLESRSILARYLQWTNRQDLKVYSPGPSNQIGVWLEPRPAHTTSRHLQGPGWSEHRISLFGAWHSLDVDWTLD